MLNVQSYSLTPVAFKGKSKEKSGKTNAALKTNVAAAVIDSAMTVGGAAAGIKLSRYILKYANEIEIPQVFRSIIDKNIDISKQTLRRSKWVLPIGLLLSAGSGVLVDKATNKKRAEFDEKVKSLGADKVLATDKHAKMSKNGGIYYKTNEGKKWSTLLLGVTSTLTNALFTSESKVMKGSAMKKVLPIVISNFLGGFIYGSIADACANKSAKKAANALAQKNVNNVKA